MPATANWPRWPTVASLFSCSPLAGGTLLQELGVDVQSEADKTHPLRVKGQADLPSTNQP